MNFKINNIEKDIECQTPVFEELNLLCGKTMVGGKEKVLINATKYCDSIGKLQCTSIYAVEFQTDKYTSQR